MGIHAFIIFCVVGIGWRFLHQATPGLPLLINEVIVGDGETGGGGTLSATPKSQPPKQQLGEEKTQVHTPSPQSSPEGEGDSTLAAGNTGGANTGSGSTGNAAGTGHGGAGDPTLAEIRRRIESAKRYPAQARAMHQEGRVEIHFRIQPNGQVTEVQVSQSSGIRSLDDAAVQAVQRSAPLPIYNNAIDLSLAFQLR